MYASKNADEPAEQNRMDAWTDEMVWRWFREYLSRPHPEIGRSGNICPFIEPAMRAGAVDVRLHGADGSTDLEGLRRVVFQMISVFQHTTWKCPNRTLRALVFAFPYLPERSWGLLDELHLQIKTTVVGHGLMLGQFHPHCNEPAARNRSFAVSRSPVPMLALRSIAFHDVMFLSDDPAQFAVYRERFGHRYRSSGALDPLFVSIFKAAERAYLQPDPGRP